MQQSVDVIELIWTASWQASVVAVIVLALHWCFGRRLTPRWRLALWSVVFLRMVLLITPGSSWSVFNWTHLPDSAWQSTIKSQDIYVPPSAVDHSTATGDGVVLDVSDAIQETSLAWSWREVLALVYTFGLLACLITFALLGYLMTRRLHRLPTVTDQAFESLLADCAKKMRVRRLPRAAIDDRVGAPALFGLFHPTLILPTGLTSSLSSTQLRHVLMHELAHLKRHDLVKNWLLILLCSMHWFNPVLWFAVKRYRADRELVCDAIVVEELDDGAGQTYGSTLLDILEHVGGTQPSRLTITVGIGESFTELKRRIAALAIETRPLRRWSVVGFVVLLALSAITLTGRLQEKVQSVVHAAPAKAVVAKEPAKPSPLDKRIEVNFEDNKLVNVLEFLRFKANVDFVTDWNLLSSVGVEREHSVTLTVSNPTPVYRILELVMQQVSAGNELDPLGFAYLDGLVHVSTLREIRKRTTTVKNYDVSDILEENDPDELLKLIRSSTARQEQWAVFGGSESKVSEFNRKLVVKAPEETHREVVRLLAQLRGEQPTGPEGTSTAERPVLSRPESEVVPGVIQAKLKTKLNVRFEKDKLVHVFKYIAGQTDIDMQVRWDLLEKHGITKNWPITLQLTNADAEQVLEIVLVQISAEDDSPSNSFQDAAIDGVLWIAPRDAILKMTTTTEIHSLKAFNSDQYESIVNLIRESTGLPADWKENGGELANVRRMNDKLIVRAPAEFQNSIRVLLSQLAESQKRNRGGQ